MPGALNNIALQSPSRQDAPVVRAHVFERVKFPVNVEERDTLALYLNALVLSRGKFAHCGYGDLLAHLLLPSS